MKSTALQGTHFAGHIRAIGDTVHLVTSNQSHSLFTTYYVGLRKLGEAWSRKEKGTVVGSRQSIETCRF